MSENILESELFGHVKGAFTDASADRVGKFEYAHGGTLFLDEVGDMPLATQIKLLRVLENNEITRVGSNDPIKVNVRLLSATNSNLESGIEAGTFRSDLYHRLKVITLRLPSLRRAAPGHPHADRLLPQAIRFPARQADQGHVGRRAAPTVDVRLAGQRPPVKNVVESMVVVDYDGLLDMDDLPEELAGPAEPAAEPGEQSLAGLVGRTLVEVEKLFVAETLRLSGGNRELAAEKLGIGERTLYRKIKEFGI